MEIVSVLHHDRVGHFYNRPTLTKGEDIEKYNWILEHLTRKSKFVTLACISDMSKPTMILYHSDKLPPLDWSKRHKPFIRLELK